MCLVCFGLVFDRFPFVGWISSYFSSIGNMLQMTITASECIEISSSQHNNQGGQSMPQELRVCYLVICWFV
jgi:hypothetical protein